MKVNKLFVTALAAAALFASCAKGNDDAATAGTSNMQVKISVGGSNASTYTVDTPVGGGTHAELTHVIIFEMRGTDVFAMKTISDASSLTALTGVGYTLANVNNVVDGIVIVANAPTSDRTALLGLKTKTAIDSYAFAIADQQSKAGAEGVKHVVIRGSGDVTATSDPAKKKAEVTAAPIVGRMEVSGTIQKKVGTAETPNLINEITITDIYFNRYYSTGEPDNLVNLTEKELASWGTPAWTTDALSGADLSAFLAKSKCCAYQFFPGDELPMIVVKANVTLTSGSPMTGVYLTLRTYKTTGGTAISRMVPNKIYKVDLNTLFVDHTDFTPTPNPDQVDLVITVSIDPWTTETITPEL